VTDEDKLETTEPAADRRDNNDALLEPCQQESIV
jgi:hypothetical protein